MKVLYPEEKAFGSTSEISLREISGTAATTCVHVLVFFFTPENLFYIIKTYFKRKPSLHDNIGEIFDKESIAMYNKILEEGYQ